MFESIKSKLWDFLKQKEVSLAMIYNNDGDILWHKGRDIVGANVKDGDGFPKSHIKTTLGKGDAVEEEDVVITSEPDDISRSAYVFKVKSILIQPISNNFFLYLDSGTKYSFNETDREIFKVFGGMLGEMISQVKKSQEDIGGITGASEEINHIRDLVLMYSLEENLVLLLGETGTGKSRIAELIHRYSGRTGKFVTVNTPGIPENLFESEVFGHKKGSFTGAASDKRGFVDEAGGGTLFFDEIAEIPLTFQAKLLRFIETKKYQVLGDPEEKEADVRILAATNKDLKKAIEDREFREDLYYRLQVLVIDIPPLRKRKKDIKELVLENLSLLKGKKIGEGFWEEINGHDWTGNVRELITFLIRLGIHSSDPVSGEDVKKILGSGPINSLTEGTGNRFDEFLESINRGEDFWEVVWSQFIKRDINKRELKAFLTKGYERNNFSLKQLSIELNIKDSDYKKFIAILHKYKIHPAK